MLTPLDYGVIAFYFLFMAGLGWFFRRNNATSSDYFRAGGAQPWWLAGASAFMASFSAWTFTGAAGIAYEAGFVIGTLYVVNAVGPAVGGLWFASRFRQMRAITVIEAIRQRLGAANEQIIVWLGLPLAVIRAAIWLYGLAIFVSPVFGLDLRTVIVVCGGIVALVSALGGSHAVVTGDFMQALLLIPITIVMCVVSLLQTGGLGPLLERLPPGHFDLFASEVPGFGLLWLVALLCEKIIFSNNISTAGRYLCVADSRDARRSAWLASGLFLAGAFLWIVPPLAARSLGLDLAAQFPALAKPAEACYAAMALLTLPPGLLGLLVTALMAATLSSMDAGLNANAGTFVRGFYHPVLRPRASEQELVWAGRLTTGALGMGIVILALEYSSWRNVGVFTLMFNVSAMLVAPGMVPLFWCIFTRRSPDWAVWSAQLVGFANSVLVSWVPQSGWFARTGLLPAESIAWLHAYEYPVTMISNTVICSLWFWGATRFFPGVPPTRRERVERFFATVAMPVPVGEEQSRESVGQTGRAVGRLCLVYAAFLLIVALVPNTARGHLGLFFCAGFMAVIGAVLTWLPGRKGGARAAPAVTVAADGGGRG